MYEAFNSNGFKTKKEDLNLPKDFKPSYLY